MIAMFQKLKIWAQQIKSDVITVYFAAKDPRCSWGIRFLAMLVAAYALSPIDLIPDFIPVLGHLDDLLIVPAGLWLVIRLLPPQLLADAREQAARLANKPRNHVTAAVFVFTWLVFAVWLLSLCW